MQILLSILHFREILPKRPTKVLPSQFATFVSRGLYMISKITHWEIQLDDKNPHLIKLQISEPGLRVTHIQSLCEMLQHPFMVK